jgi:hypothetical protein
MFPRSLWSCWNVDLKGSTVNPLTAINELAKLAAESSIDAHGEPVEPQLAWDILKEQIAPEDSQVAFLFAHAGENMPRHFIHDYARQYRNITESKAVEE